MGRRDNRQFDIFRQIEREMRRFTEDALRAGLFQPRVDLFETANALIAKVELAGVQPERLRITLSADGRTLTISGARAETFEERRECIGCHQLEIYYGEFERNISLPAALYYDGDAITAHYRDGFLVVILPKRERMPGEPRTIEISKE